MNDRVLTVDEVARVRQLVRELGEPKAVEILQVSRVTLPRLVARLPTQRGTVALVRQRLKENNDGKSR